MLLPPVGLKFGWGEIPQCGMDALVLIDLLGTMPNLGVSIGIVLIVGKVDFFFLNSSDDALSIAVLPSRADFGHADFYLKGQQLLHIGTGCILDALIAVMNLRRL